MAVVKPMRKVRRKFRLCTRLVLTCAATALRWADMLWHEERIRVLKRWAKAEDGETRTDASDGYVPLHPVLAGHLRGWQQQTPHAKPTDFAFPSIKAKGRKPLYASTFICDRPQRKPECISKPVKGSDFTTCVTA
jgi:integrase